MTRLGEPAQTVRVGVIGDHQEGFAPHDAIETSLTHSGAVLGVEFEVSWFATPSLERYPALKLADTDALWGAPGSPYVSLEGSLEGIRFAREQRLPFLGTCSGFQHGVVEIARNVARIADAQHAEYGDTGGPGPLIIDRLLSSPAGQRMDVDLVDPQTEAMYGCDVAHEEYYCRFGLQESFRLQLAQAGLIVVGVDSSDGGTRIMRLAGRPFFYLTLFVPQTSSLPERPHPLITAFLAATARSITDAP